MHTADHGVQFMSNFLKGDPEYVIPKIKMLCNLRCLKAR